MQRPSSTEFMERLKHSLDRKTVVFLACLGLSALFWLLTSLSKDYIEVIKVPVLYQNLPEDMLVVNELSTHIDAEVKIFGFDLLWYWLRFDRVELPIDATPDKLRKVMRGGNEIHIVLINEKKSGIAADFAEQFQLLNLSPDTLFIKLAPLFSKKIPVKLNADISFERQFGMIDQPLIQPDSVLISGLKEAIDTIQFIQTEKEDWTDLSESVTSNLQLQEFDESRLIQLSHSAVVIELNVVEFTEGTVTVPVQVSVQKPERVKLFPKQVDITYQVPLAAYGNISADQFQVSVSFSEEESKELTRLTVNVDAQPDHVRQIRVNPPQVEFIIQK